MTLLDQLPQLIQSYGYWLIGGIVLLESMGLPLPGETTLITAAVYAGTTHNLNITLVILATIAGAVIGDNVGYWMGEKLGYRALLRYGPSFGVTARKIKVGQYLFHVHGGKVVFFGRFVAVLRILAAFLAGVNCMPWGRFFIANLTGATIWAAAFGLGSYWLGNEIHKVAGPVGFAALGLAFVTLVVAAVALHRHVAELEEAAERALPGPLPTP